MDGALIVAAPLITIGLLNVNVLTFDSSIELAPIVIGAEAEPNAAALLAFKLPLFTAMLVLMVLVWSRLNTPFVPAKVNVETLIGLVCDNVAVSVMVKPAPVKPSTLDKVPIDRLEAVWKLKLPVPILPASTLMTEFEPVSV